MKVYDQSGKEYEKDSVDANECVRVLGWRLTKEKTKDKADLTPVDSIKNELDQLSVDYSGVSGVENLRDMLRLAKSAKK